MGGFNPLPPFTISSYPLETPEDFSSFNNPGYGITIAGEINGINSTFTTGVTFRKVFVYRNGLKLVQNHDFAAGSNVIVFLGDNIPQPGDVLRVTGWVGP